MTPLPSHPGVLGRGKLPYPPPMNIASEGFTGEASTFIRNSPFCNSGIGTVST